MPDQAYWSPIRHIGLRSGILVSNQAYWSPIRQIGLRLGILVSDQAYWSQIRHIVLRLVSDNNLFTNISFKYLQVQFYKAFELYIFNNNYI